MSTPVVVTDRLVLRPYDRSDRAEFVALVTDEEVNRFGDGPMDDDEAGPFFDRFVPSIYERNDFDVWAVTDAATGAYVGHAELKPSEHAQGDANELVYFLLQSWWGRGLGTEVVRAILVRAAERGLRTVVATIHPANDASLRLVGRLGFRTVAEEDDGTIVLHRTVELPGGGPTG